VPVNVPRFGVRGISSPIPVYQAEPRVNRDTLSVLVPNPRATAIFGQDSTLLVYVEEYGTPGRLQVAIRDVNNQTTWRDSVDLPRSATMASGKIALPLTQLGPGVGSLLVWNGADTARTPIVISFGEGLAITSFDEMLSYLRYFGLPDDLNALRNAPQSDRGRAWLAFLRSTDPNPATPEHEGLRDYFVRVEQANLRYREEGGPGWLTDRGRVFIALGDPDQIYEQGQGDIAQRNRVLIWDYAQYRVQLVFVDQSGFGRYRLTSTSEVEFQSLVRRVRQR
jgi:GWxTD domain-containing protein